MTSYSTVLNAFLRRVEKDYKFFNYFGLSDSEAMQLARERALGYMEESVALLTMNGLPKIDFSERDEPLGAFQADLTAQEIYILSSLMYRQYLDRDIAYLSTLSVNYTSTDLRVFDPSNARKTFFDLYAAVCAECDRLVDTYKNTDRKTGAYIGIDFDQFDTAES